jgi:hypothetical protein
MISNQALSDDLREVCDLLATRDRQQAAKQLGRIIENLEFLSLILQSGASTHFCRVLFEAFFHLRVKSHQRHRGPEWTNPTFHLAPRA